ncbi:MAG TPA: hypothetical protein VLI05_01760 [Candidatus Saccharimonadia bacterium]|nr:hypothetical protein [Candidatus Saccharimonadia bacterium]
MATVDFTLDDVRQVVEEVVDERLEVRLDERFKAERQHTRQLMYEVAREVVRSELEVYDEQLKEFLTFHFGQIYPRLDRIEYEVRGLKQVVRKHSADIAELQVRAAH